MIFYLIAASAYGFDKETLYDHYRSLEGPEDMLYLGLNFFEYNSAIFPNKDYLTLIDISKHSSQKRMYLLELKTKQLFRFHVAHGVGSDVDNDGFAESFSNEEDTKKTSLGFYRVSESYFSSKFKSNSLRLDGLSVSNSNARKRGIVLHAGVKYIHGEKHKYIQSQYDLVGRTYGCPAVDEIYLDFILSKIQNGSMLLIYHEKGVI